MFSVKVLLTEVLLESRNVTVTAGLPGELGVPLIVPLADPIDNPAGSPDAVHEYGGSPPSASIVNEYETPVVPGGSVVVLILRAAPRSSGADVNTKTNTLTASAATFNPLYCFTSLTATPPSPRRNGRSGRYQTTRLPG